MGIQVSRLPLQSRRAPDSLQAPPHPALFLLSCLLLLRPWYEAGLREGRTHNSETRTYFLAAVITWKFFFHLFFLFYLHKYSP